MLYLKILCSPYTESRKLLSQKRQGTNACIIKIAKIFQFRQFDRNPFILVRNFRNSLKSDNTFKVKFPIF